MCQMCQLRPLIQLAAYFDDGKFLPVVVVKHVFLIGTRLLKNDTVFVLTRLNLVVAIFITGLYLINEITPRSQFIFENCK